MVEPHSGSVVVVPLPLCPWYLQSVMMYAESLSCNHAGVGFGATLLRVLGTCQVVLIDVAPGAFGRVRSFNGRTGKLPQKAALYFCRESRCMFLRSEGAFRVSIDRDNSTRAWHLELKVHIMRHRVEFCERGSSEQSVIATAEWDYVED